MKNLFAFVAAFAFIFTASAQEINFGIKAGFNISSLLINYKEMSFKGKTGFYAGGVIDIPLSQRIHLQSEVYFSREGAGRLKFKSDGMSSTGEKAGYMDFLNIPVLGKFYAVEGFHLLLGPQMGILLGAEQGTDGLKALNFSGAFGLGYDFEGGFFIESRYTIGITPIYEEEILIPMPNYNLSLHPEMRTQAFQVGVGYKF